MPTRKWGSEILVNTTVAGDQTNSKITVLAGGGFVVVWQDDRSADSAILAQLYDAVGNRIGGELTLAAAAGIDFVLPDVTALADGSFYFTATQLVGADNYIVGAVYDASGAVVRAQHVVFAFGQDTNSDVARLGTGSVVTWEDPNGVNTDILFRIFDAAGTGGAVLSANTATAAAQQDPSAAAAPDAATFAIVWDSNFDFTIRGRLFTAAGAEFAPEFLIATGSQAASDPAVVWLNNEEFAVVWRDVNSFNAGSNQIKVKIFDGQSATPTALTGNILVNSTMADYQQNPQITALPNGGFVVSWEDNSGVGGDSDFAIRLQAFDGAGGKIGGEFLVNTTTTNYQFGPSITALADGRVVVSWTDASSGNQDIRMQIIDPRDGIVTGTGGADILYGHDSVGDEISGFAGDDTLFGLRGNDSLYGGDGKDTAFGAAGDDVAYGGAGNDDLRGGVGDDDLFGEDSNDVLIGGAGADILNGGAGIDTASYVGAKLGVTVSLNGTLVATGDADGDVLVLIENLTGSNLAASGDTLRGNTLANILSGLAGNDSLNGGSGNDTLIGGLGADTLTGGLGNDSFQYSALADAGDIITDFSSAAAGNNDAFKFKGSAFGGLAAGSILANQFQSSTSASAGTTDVRFYYETDTGILRYDADGSNAGAATIIATLQAGATMTLSDILII